MILESRPPKVKLRSKSKVSRNVCRISFSQHWIDDISVSERPLEVSPNCFSSG